MTNFFKRNRLSTLFPRRLLRLSSCLAVLLVSAAIASAQQGIGSIGGKVTDEAGGMISDATVTITNKGTLVSTVVKTDASGVYTSPPLNSGAYNVQVEKATFRPEAQNDFELNDDQRAELNFTLKAGSVSESVEVQADAPAMNTFNASLGSVIDNSVAEALPSNGGSTLALAQLDPGVVSASGPVNEGFNDRGVGVSNIRIGAGLSGANANLLDGANNLQTTRGEILINTTITGVQETRLQYGVISAQYGLLSGGIITTTTKSGTNAWHGEAYEYFRNSALNAINHFALKGTRPAINYNQYGAAIGGPIFKDKAFFFGNYEAYSNHQVTPTTITVPTLQERTGDFSDNPSAVIYDATTQTACTANSLPVATCRYQYGYQAGAGKGVNGNPVPSGQPINALPTGSLDKSALAYQEAFVPKPNQLGFINNYVASDPLISSQISSLGRLDWQIRNNLSAFARYAYYENKTNNEGSYGSLSPIASTRLDDLIDQDLTIGITQVVSGTMLNDIRVALGRSYFPFTAGSSGQNWPHQLGIGGSVPQNTLPVVSATGYGLTSTANQGLRTSTVPEVNDTVTILHGLHSLHIGAGVRGYESYNNSNTYPSGQFSFSSTTTAQAGTASTSTGNAYATFLLGEAASITAQTSAGSTARIFSVNGYVQDDWRALPNLTLNLGLRYDYQSIPWEKGNGFSTLRPDLIDPDNGLWGREIYASPKARNFEGENYHDFAPRIGFAWLLSKNHLSVIRGGYAIYYAASSNTVYTNASDGFSTNTTTYVAPTAQGYVGLFSAGLPSAPLSLPGSAGGPGALLGQSPTIQPQSGPTSATQQMNLAFDHTFPAKTILSVFGIYSHGTHFPMTGLNLNQLDPKYFQLGPDSATTNTLLTATTTNPYASLMPATASASLSGKTFQEQQALRPYPYFQNVYLYYPHIGNFSGRALQVVLSRPVFTGLQMQIGYNYGRLLADPLTSAVTASPTVSAALQNNYQPHSEYGIDPTDVTHRISGNMTYTFPFGKGQRFLASSSDRVQKFVSGWNLAGTIIGETGRPLQITGGNSAGATRPNFVAGVSKHVPNPGPNEWFNTAAFAIAPLWSFGNVPRTESDLRGPGDFSLNVNLTKTTTLSKRFQFQFQISAYNALNKTNLGTPNVNLPVTATTLTNLTAFGTITTASQPRTMQLVARIRF